MYCGPCWRDPAVPELAVPERAILAADALIVARLRAAGCVFAEDEARLLAAAAQTPGELDAMVDRRAAGQPLEHVLGWAEFARLRIAVDPGVFVPRRRSEFLVGQAAAVARPGDVIVDLCCGAGAIGIALAAAVPRADLYAADIDPAAVRCARRNAATYAPARGFTTHVYQGDLYQPLPRELRGRVAVLTANVPYVPTGEIAFLPPEARTHEPRLALDGGGDGLDLLRRVAAEASRWLAPGGHLFVETSERQAKAAGTAFAASGLVAGVISDEDLAATVITGQRPG